MSMSLHVERANERRRCHFFQVFIAILVAEFVIDVLEIIQIKQHQGKILAFQPRGAFI